MDRPRLKRERPARADAAALHGAWLGHIYDLLEAAHGSARWHWMAETPAAELCFGAILVQHTAWTQVERALERLKAADALSFDAVRRLSDDPLAELVRPAGMPLSKARRLKALGAAIDRESGGDLQRFLAMPAARLRAVLLSTYGIGKETADAIALYAGGKPLFVIDNYTTRLFTRLGRHPARGRYDDWQRWFEQGLATRAARTAPGRLSLYRRYHAVIVMHGKAFCRARPLCSSCPLAAICDTGLAG